MQNTPIEMTGPHKIFVNKTSAELIEVYNMNRKTWTVPTPMGAHVSDYVRLCSSDGVEFLCRVGGIHADNTMTIWVTG